MNRKTYLEKIINEFEDWWIKDPHSSNMDFYKNTITISHLTSLSNRDFVDFFYEFVRFIIIIGSVCLVDSLSIMVLFIFV